MVKKRVQARFARAFEVIVSPSDFELSTYFIGDFICKIYRYGYYAMTYEAPHQNGVEIVVLQQEANSVSCLQQRGGGSVLESVKFGSTWNAFI